jgi:hypothetical protein
MVQESRTMTGRLLLLLNVVAANVAAAVYAIAFLRPSTVGAVSVEVQGERLVGLPLGSGAAWLAFLVAVLVLLLNVWWLFRRRQTEPPLQHVLSEAPGGSVRISREALEAGLRAAGEAVPGITRLRVAVSSGGSRRILVQGQFQCAEGTANLQLSQRLRTALQERFASMVRLPDGVRVEFELEFQGFAGKPQKRAAEPSQQVEEPAPFTGPRYPIDAEDGP